MSPPTAAPVGLGRRLPRCGRPGRAVLEHAPAHGRAHGALEGHLAARLHRQGGRLRERRAGAQGLGRALQGRGGLRADLPALRGPGHRRGAARLPAAQRLGGRRLAGRARRGQPGHRRRPVPRGPDRAGHPPGRGGHAARRRPADPRPGRAGPRPQAQRRRHRRGHLLHHQRRPVRHLLHRADHQPAPGGHPGHRRHRPPPGRGHPRRRDRVDRHPLHRGARRAAGTTGPSTAPTCRSFLARVAELLGSRDWAAEL